MTPDELRNLRRVLSVIDEPRRFFYCPAGSDGYPLLLVGHRLPPRKLLAVRRWAQEKVFVRGQVVRDAGALVFIPDGDRHSELLAADLAGFFAENLPGTPPLRLLPTG